MFFIVRNQIVQGETVMAGNKIYAGMRVTSPFIIEIAAPRKPFCHLRESGLLSVVLPGTPKMANGVAVFSVPFGP
jgi:hypothetical protein